MLPTKKSHADVKSRIAIINRLIGFYSAAALTPKVLAAYRDERMTKVKGHTVRKELHLIGRILKHAQKEWEINLPRGNPVDSVTIPAQPKGRQRRLNSKEEKKLLKDAGCTVAKLRNIIRFAIETGCVEVRSVSCGGKMSICASERPRFGIPKMEKIESRHYPLKRSPF